MDCRSASKVMSGHFSLLLLVFLILSLPACADSAQEARAALEGMGLPFSGDAFLNQVALNNVAAVQLFLQAGIDPNARDGQGVTPLIAAAARGHGAIVKLLLDNGADVNARETQFGGTPLIHAVRGGPAETVRLHRGKKRSKKVTGVAGKDNTEIVRLLLGKKGADLEVRDAKEGRTALLWAARYDQPDTVQALLDKGADPQAKDKQGNTALALAAVFANPDTLSLLLDRTGPPEKDPAAMPPLLLAAAAGRPDNVRFLLDKGADINVRDAHGATALMWAAQAGKPDAVQLLLERGADADARDQDGKKALDVAKSNDELRLMLFRTESNKPSPPKE